MMFAKAISDVGYGGQIVISGEIWNSVSHNLGNVGYPQVIDLGVHLVKNRENGAEVHLVELLPRTLAKR